jgi:hypothetical protein
LFALLLLVVGWSAQGVAQPDVFAPLDLLPAVAHRSEGESESARWCTVLHDAPQGEVSAAEAEADSEPVTPELPSIIKPVFGCAAKVTIAGQVPRAATETYSVRFAASPVLARAPPSRAR